MANISRRDALKAIAGAGGLMLAPTVSASEASNRFIVDVGEVVDSTDLDRLRSAGLEIVHDIKPIGYVVVRGTPGSFKGLEYEFVPDQDLGIDEPVEKVTFDERDVSELDIPDQDTESIFESTPSYRLQWDKQAQDLPSVLEHSTGAGARVAVVDTGVFTHPGLPTLNTDLSIDVTGEDDPFIDARGHGTHVAGIIAANPYEGASEAGFDGTWGTAPEAEIVSVRYFASDGSTGDFLLAITYAAAHEDETVSEELELTGAECDVINTSLGTPPLPPKREYFEQFEEAYQTLADFADARQTVWASSAGNDGTNATRENWLIGPAGVDKVLSVSATGPIGFQWGEPSIGVPFGTTLKRPTTHPAYYTDHGEDYVDLSAAGGNVSLDAVALDPDGIDIAWHLDLVFNTYAEYDSDSGEMVFRYDWLAGTSMAAPQVAGAAALVKSEHPDISANEVRHHLKSTATDEGPATYHGWGHLNLMNVVKGVDTKEQRIDRSAHHSREDRNRRGTAGQPGGRGSSGAGRGGNGDSRRYRGR